MISSIFFCSHIFYWSPCINIYIYIFWGKDFNTTQPPSSTNKIQKKTQCFNNNHYRKASVSHAQKMGQFAKATANFIAAYASLTQSMEDEKKRKLESQVGATLKRLRFSKIKWFCSCIPQLEIGSQFQQGSFGRFCSQASTLEPTATQCHSKMPPKLFVWLEKPLVSWWQPIWVVPDKFFIFTAGFRFERHTIRRRQRSLELSWRFRKRFGSIGRLLGFRGCWNQVKTNMFFNVSPSFFRWMVFCKSSTVPPYECKILYDFSFGTLYQL